MNDALRQKILLVTAVLVNLVAGLVAIPIISRGFSSDEFATVSILLLINGMFGAFDFFRPVFVSEFSAGDKLISIADMLTSSVVALLFLSVPIYILYSQFLSSHFSGEDFRNIFIAFFLFVFSSGFWAALDINNKVGVSALLRSFCVAGGYLFYSVEAVFKNSIALSFGLLIIHGVSLFLFVLLSFPYLSIAAKRRAGQGFYRKAFWTFGQNLSKVVIDFCDRLFVSRFFSPEVTGSYNLIYDVASRSGVFSQVWTTYSYPKLCESKDLVSRFLVVGIGLSSLIFVLGLLFLIFGQQLYILYFGERLVSFFKYFCAMIFAFSIFSLAFFSQAGLRAVGRYAYLSFSFAVSAVVGLVSIYPLYLFFGLKGVLLCFLLLKLPGVFGYWYMRALLGKYEICFYALVLCNCLLFFYVVFAWRGV
jgi:O-antigen/teichoic acid export membrane protein